MVFNQLQSMVAFIHPNVFHYHQNQVSMFCGRNQITECIYLLGKIICILRNGNFFTQCMFNVMRCMYLLDLVTSLYSA